MHGPATVGWLLVALSALTGLSCLYRARHGPAGLRRAAWSEAAAGFGMAAMALPLPAVSHARPVATAVLFAAFFGAGAVWEAALARARRRAGRPSAHHVHHVVGALAMVYMAVAMVWPAAGRPGGSGHALHGAAPAGGGLPLLTAALLAYLAWYVLRTGLRLLPGGGPTGGGPRTAGPPPPAAGSVADRGPGGGPDLAGFATACRLAMGTGMFAMLLTL